MQAFLSGVGFSFLFIIACLIPALLIRRFTRIGREPFRKLLHGIAQGLILALAYGFETWYHAVIFCALFIVLGYPALHCVEKYPIYARLTNQRRDGEVKNSLVLLFLMYIVILSICWGVLDDRFLAVASVFAWGFGDAAAGLIGRRYGRHKVRGTLKSWEGTAAMFIVSWVCAFLVLLLRGRLGVPGCLLTAMAGAAVSAAVELYTTGGHDTITCPLSAMAVMVPLAYFLEGLL